MQTLGKSIDELIVTNLKIWHLENIKRQPNASDKQIADATRKTNVLNTNRNKLMDEINGLIGIDSYSGIKLYD